MKKNQPIQKIDLGKDVLTLNDSETIFLIGRSKECHVVLDDKKISREHVRIIHKAGKWYCEKTAENNLCLLNGEDFKKNEIVVGDVLTIEGYSINIEKSEQNNAEAVLKPKIVEELKSDITSPSSFSKKEDDLTSEVAIPNLSHEVESVESSSDDSSALGEMTSEIELPSEFEQHEEPQVPKEDEFNYEENPEVQAEFALGLTEEKTEGQEESANSSYSLESINTENDDNDSTQVMQSFAKVQLELFGDTAPYDKYLITSEKTFIGRDAAKCQIVLNDSEVSAVHAVVVRTNAIITLEDLNSSNGTILNGDRVNKSTLKHNDEFVIGGVSFTVKVRSDFLKEENSTLMPVDENQTVEVEEVVEVEAEEGENVDALGGMISNAPEEKSIIKRIWKDDEKRKKAIYALVILAGAWLMFGDEKPASAPAVTKKSKKAQTKSEQVSSNVTSKKLSDEEKRALSARYEIGKNHYYNGRYREALDEFQKISTVDPNFNSSLQSLIALSKEGLGKLEEQEKKRIAEQALAEKKIKIKELLVQANTFVKERRVEMAQEIFNEIAKIDPENISVTQLKLELEDWLKEKARKDLEEASKKKSREDKVEKLKPGKVYFLQKEWFKAIGKLDDFLRVKDMDEDLTKEASEMLKTSHDELNAAVAPLLGKAKSMMEGQDLKGAYETYQQILKIDPSSVEALNATGEIKDQLTTKARKIYREAIISESLSLFQDAKEKFQEVQQISPVDSDYYKKASDKLKDYLE